MTQSVNQRKKSIRISYANS